MGLDITAYRQLKPCEKPEGADEGDYDYDRYFHAYPNQDFPGRDAGLVGEWFEYRCDDGADPRRRFAAAQVAI